MNGRYGRALTVVATVGSGLAAAVFFAFSTFVMTALDRLPDREGLRAMQEINDAAPTPWFVVPWIGTAAVCVALVVISLRRRREASAPYVLAGSVLYLAGIIVTFADHIPKNDDLALVDPNSAGAVSAWNDYQTPWTAWNHVRTLAFVAAAILFAVALVASGRSEATSKTARPVGELAGATDFARSGVQR
jgi:uncharacterized membrane protein